MKKKTKIYLDTSVISYLDQPERGEKYQESHMLWQQIRQGFYEVYLSDVTLEEIRACKPEKALILWEYLYDIPFEELETTTEIRELAEKIIGMGILSQKHYDDCMHIAHATVAQCKTLLSWNFKHLVTFRTNNGIRAVNICEGYPEINILAPSMLIYDSKLYEGEE
jgi:predicted nucleic acid-binding protein